MGPAEELQRLPVVGDQFVDDINVGALLRHMNLLHLGSGPASEYPRARG
jgi:hypothetical protein